MVGIRDRVFLVCGANFEQRRQAVANIKKRILPGKSAAFGIHTFYSKETNLKELSENIFSRALGKNKVIIFKDFHNLSSAVRDFLFSNFKKILADNYIIFETDKDQYELYKSKKFISDKFFAFILKRAASFKVVSPKKQSSIVDFMNSLRRGDLNSSLYILESLFKADPNSRLLGPQVIGILVRKFSYPANTKDSERYFEYLWKADRAIKEKGLPHRLVIETLLVRLFTAS